MNLVEAEDHFVLKADLPGLDDGDGSIEVQDGTLTVSGERQAEHESRERGWYRIERSFGSFEA
jgi:HSP20 family protein